MKKKKKELKCQKYSEGKNNLRWEKKDERKENEERRYRKLQNDSNYE